MIKWYHHMHNIASSLWQSSYYSIQATETQYHIMNKAHNIPSVISWYSSSSIKPDSLTGGRAGDCFFPFWAESPPADCLERNKIQRWSSSCRMSYIILFCAYTDQSSIFLYLINILESFGEQLLVDSTQRGHIWSTTSMAVGSTCCIQSEEKV